MGRPGFEHMGVVDDDLHAANAFLIAMGCAHMGEDPVEGETVSGINGPTATVFTTKTKRRGHQ